MEDTVGKLSREELKQLEQLDKVLANVVMDCVATSVKHALKNEMFVAGRYLSRAEGSAGHINDHEVKVAAQKLVEVVFLMCTELERMIVAGMPNRQAKRREIVQLLLDNGAWQALRGEDSAKELEALLEVQF